MKSEEIRKKPSIRRIHEQYEYYKNVPERGLMIKGRPALTQIDHEKVGDFVLITVRDPLCAYDVDPAKKIADRLDHAELIGNSGMFTSYTGTYKGAKITVVSGSACIQRAGVIACHGETYEAEDIVIATGSKVSYPPISGIDLPGVYNSRDLLEGGGREVSSLVIIGGGVVGVECASIYHCLGCEVTVLEAADHILPFMDREIAQRLTMILKKKGVKVEAKASVQKITGTPGEMTVTYTDKKGAEHTVTAQGVLAAAGRKANLDGLFGPDFSLELDRGAVVGDDMGRTSVPHVYVIGDAKAKNIQLAHVASAQGENVVAVIAGKNPPLDLSVVPSCVYTEPEIASVGLTEEGAKAAGIPVKTGKYLTGANGKCLIEGTESGYVKLVTDGASGRILGAQLVCPRATDMVGELTLAIQKGLTADDLSAVIHPHPTFSEMLFGAAEGLRLE